MLVLRRSLDEAVVIDGRITVRLLETGRGWCRLGIGAPDGVKILREELVVIPSDSPDANDCPPPELPPRPPHAALPDGSC